MPQPYVSRPEAEAFLAALADAIKAPKENLAVFHLGGMEGSTVAMGQRLGHK